jgi:hypothetical protein
MFDICLGMLLGAALLALVLILFNMWVRSHNKQVGEKVKLRMQQRKEELERRWIRDKEEHHGTVGE